MTLPVGDHADTSQVSTAGHHAQVTWEGAGGRKNPAQHIGIISGSSSRKYCNSTGEEVTSIELDEICNLAGVQVDTDGIVDLDEGVWVADGAGVVGHQVGDSLGTNDDLLHLAQLVLQSRRWVRTSAGNAEKKCMTEKVFSQSWPQTGARLWISLQILLRGLQPDLFKA